MATNDQKPSAVLWPDLSRFGAQMTVAFNPSVGRNFLRLAVLDRQRFAAYSGLNPEVDDFFRVMRNAGFTYAPGETQQRRNVAVRDAQLGDDQGAEAERIYKEESEKLYFYSADMAVRRERLKTFVPALLDSDLRHMQVADIKHFDYAYLSDKALSTLLENQQAFDDAEPGVFYTTPEDRKQLESLVAQRVMLNDALGVRLGGNVSEHNEARPLAGFFPVRVVERLLRGSTLTEEGVPLRAFSPTAAVICYPSRAAAVEANGGEDGVERIVLPYALPLAFAYPDRRVVIIKDARYIEAAGDGFYHAVRDRRAVQDQWNLIAAAKALEPVYRDGQNQGVFDTAAWGDEKVLFAAKEVSDALRASMRKMLEGVTLSTEFVTSYELNHYGGLRSEGIARVFDADFVAFLEGFELLASECDQRVESHHAEHAARQGMLDALAKVQTLDSTQLASRREDAGEKIGGARKDYAKRWLDTNELTSMTAREWVEVVSKDNVWPSPNYAAMAEQGVDPAVAYVIRDLRGALPTNPYRGGYNIKRYHLQRRAAADLTLTQCESFVNAVALVRDALAEVKTRSDLLSAIVAIREQSAIKGYSWNSEHWFHDGAGYHFCARALPEVSLKNGAWSSYRLGNLLDAADLKTAGGWEWCSKKSAKTRVQEDAPEETTAAKKQRLEPDIPHLDHIERDGPDYRGGKPVDEQVLMDVFGFRGVEYGNWLPQDERQTVLNHAFDAFMDLAAALKLPPKAMSLGGELAVAFGARGRGGKRAAAAHFEPGRFVINLTRLSGAGFLAHEWGHALDAFLAKSLGLSQARPLTDWVKERAKAIPPIAEAFIGIVKEARSRYRTKDEVRQEAMQIDTGGTKMDLSVFVRRRVDEWIAYLDRLQPEERRNSVFAEFAKQEAEKMYEAIEGTGGRILRMKDVGAFVQNIETALDVQFGSREWRKQAGKHNMSIPKALAEYVEQRVLGLNHIETDFEPRKFPVPSKFLSDAEYFDGERSKPYWSTNVELFARLFETWVFDEIAAKPGQKSQYLVYGREQTPDAEYSAFPQGEERERIGRVLRDFFEFHRPQLVSLLKVAESEKSRRQEVSMEPS